MENNQLGLKRLGFVRVIAVNTLLCVSNLFVYAKNNSSLFKSTVEKVENTVMPVIVPVYQKFQDVPDRFLVFLDPKVDEAIKKFNVHAPIIAKQAVSEAEHIIKRAIEEVKGLVKDAQVGGPSAAIQHSTALFKELVLWWSVRFWYLLNNIKPCNAVSHKAIPVLNLCAKKYNETVTELSSKGYPVVGYLPPVPIDDFAKAYKKFESEKGSSSSATAETAKED